MSFPMFLDPRNRLQAFVLSYDVAKCDFWPFLAVYDLHGIPKIMKLLYLTGIGMMGVISYVFGPKKSIEAICFELGCCQIYFWPFLSVHGRRLSRHSQNY